MKLLANIPPTSKLPTVADMETGDIGILVGAGVYTGETVAMFGAENFRTLVSLSIPSHTWDEVDKINLKVQLLPVGTKLTLEV